jgi:hypothetical protein
MSCAGKGYGRNPQSNDYLNAHFSSFTNTNANKNINTNNNANANTSITLKTTRNCRRYNGFYPSFTPIFNRLSVTSSSAGNYSLVYVYGSNFLPNGTTFIKFGNVYLPVTYYNSFNLSFVVPLNLVSDNYNVQVINLYNGNFSQQVNQSYPGNLNFSNSIIYTIT